MLPVSSLLSMLSAISVDVLSDVAKAVDPIRYACAQACTEAYLADKANPVLVRVIAKNFAEFVQSASNIADILNQMKQFDGDPIEHLQKLLDSKPATHRFTDGLTFELRNGSAVHVLGEA